MDIYMLEYLTTWRTLLVHVCLKNGHQMSLLTLKTESLGKAARLFLR